MLQTPMRRRRFLHTLGAASGAALLGTTGVAPLARAAKATTIRFFNNETDPNTIAFLKQMSQEYKDTTGVSIEVETVPVLQTWTKVTTAIKAGKPYDFITFGQVTEPLLLAEEQKNRSPHQPHPRRGGSGFWSARPDAVPERLLDVSLRLQL
jgi:multiple sugar transport system substrate-binding protein